MEMNKIRKVICVREKSAIDFAVAQGGNFYMLGEAGTGTSVVLVPVRIMV